MSSQLCRGTPTLKWTLIWGAGWRVEGLAQEAKVKGFVRNAVPRAPWADKASILSRGLYCQARRCLKPPLGKVLLKSWERAGAQANSHVVPSWPKQLASRQRPGPRHGRKGWMEKGPQREGLLVGNYQVKLENLTTITTSTGPGYSSEQVRGNGRRLQTEHMALQGEPT